ncbi:MAG: hypothetical protein JJ892_07260 [Balneola sp.]|nr:hypothetical protein [Balneola sp.]MBO6650929.1 hypothetical protein [Balneola sp.]MBO6711871.1 hypothetical protein [Balneola sp.]MBO6800066.1 hypothetical protein [Balneola sp.]MBO6871553.1 hypothetical protein [Balneola sp.]
MRKLSIFLLLVILINNCSDITSSNSETENNFNQENSPKATHASVASTSSSDVWVGAYMASYNHYAPPTGNWGNLPTEEIDWDAFTHLFYFSLKANADGSLSQIAPYQNMSPDRINAIVTSAHQAGKPVLFTVGGWGNYDGFSNAIKPANRSKFVSNIVNTLTEWGFDGVDLDMEPIQSTDTQNYKDFINELYSEFQAIQTPVLSKPLISVVTVWHAELFAQIQDKLDQINLMTYDLSGAWPGWVSWHNAAVSSASLAFPSNGKPLPSIDEKVKAFIQAGIPASKLGIGIDFYGYVWKGGSGTTTGGVTKPFQAWITPPTVTDNVPYYEIMQNYYQSEYYRWDNEAKAAYLSIDKPGSADDIFVSYDDEKSIQAKFDYARQNGLGGTIIWELAGGYEKDKPSGSRDKLLKAVKQAMLNGSSSPVADQSAPNVSITNPIDGSVVSQSVDLIVSANDDIGVSEVKLFIEGTLIKTFNTSSFSYSWNTSGYPNKDVQIKAVAKDAAGNTSEDILNVTVNNTIDSATGSELMIYDDQLSSPWINTSWSSTIDWNNSEQAKSGSKSIKVSQNAWGALSLRSGEWGKGVDVDPSKYTTVEFDVFATSNNTKFSLLLENDLSTSFDKYQVGTVATNQWTNISVPLSSLNPNSVPFHRINILEVSGFSKTYYIDNVKLVGSSGSGSSTTVSAPNLIAPALLATNVLTDVTLQWENVASNYDLIVATDPDFTNPVVNVQNLTVPQYSLKELNREATYYWKVKARNTNGVESPWSLAWSFKTINDPINNVSNYEAIYSDKLENNWINSSWSSTVNFNSSENVFKGSSIKVQQNKWGAFRLHSGSWSSPNYLDTRSYSFLEFKIYTEETDFNLNVNLKSDKENVTEKYSYGSIPNSVWTTVQIPISELNPDNLILNHISILDASGKKRIFFIDDLRFIKKGIL